MGTNYQRQQRGNRSTVKIDVGTFSFIGWFNTARDSHVLIWFNVASNVSAVESCVRSRIGPCRTGRRDVSEHTYRRRDVSEHPEEGT